MSKVKKKNRTDLCGGLDYRTGFKEGGNSAIQLLTEELHYLLETVPTWLMSEEAKAAIKRLIKKARKNRRTANGEGKDD